MLELHYWPTPNGKKVTILLEELGVPYKIVPCNIGSGDQFKQSFLEISPNNRMPAMVDHAPADGGAPIASFESGAIMMYLAEKDGRFYPQDLRGRYEVNQWVIWQMANQGPKPGECGHFRRLGDSQGDQSYAVRRFTDEVNRLYGVLNNRLYDRRYLAGDEYTIADMICYPWTVELEGQGQDIEEFKYFKRWFEELGARPAVQRGMAVTAGPREDPATLSAEEQERRQKLLYNQRARPAPDAAGCLDASEYPGSLRPARRNRSAGSRSRSPDRPASRGARTSSRSRVRNAASGFVQAARRRASSSSETTRSSVRAATSRRIMSPVRTSASGPPI